MTLAPAVALGLALIAGFAIGSVPFGLIVGRLFFGSDIRASGSGNIGAANALRTYGRGAGLGVLALDALKGAVAVVVPAALLPSAGPVVAAFGGLGAVAGHCYSPWLRFRGGKGVATYLGATIALSPLSALVFAAVWAAIALPTGYASAASIAGTLAAGATIVVLSHGAFAPFSFALGSLLVIVWRHRENIERLRAGTETKTSLLGKR